MTERWSTTIVRALIALAGVGAIILAILWSIGFTPAQIAQMFSQPLAPDVAEPVIETARETPATRFSPMDYGILAAYLLGMLGIGFAASRRIKTVRDFFIAGGRLNYGLVGLSLIGTYLSALTIMALPGASYGVHNWIYIVQLPFLVVTAAVITRWLLPRYRKAGVISVYAYLEQRIDVSARVLASVSFIVFSIGRMGLLLYLPALAFSTVTGAPLPWCILVMGIFITVYTVLGGIEAVVWTDAIQVVIFMAGALFALVYLFRAMDTEQFLEVGLAHGKFEYLRPSRSLAEMTTLWLILETVFQTIRIYGTQQDMTQRYLATPSVAKANRSVWISVVAYIPLGFLFYFIGTALYVFYRVNPTAPLAERADTIFPQFIVNELPAGIAGLMIAAIFAAAMSSIDSLMNANSTVCVEDFFKRFSKRPVSDASYLRQARLLTLFWGALAICLGLLFMRIEYAQIFWGKLMGVATNGILGLMALAFLPFKVHKWAAITGFAVSYIALFVMMSPLVQVNFLLWPVIGNTLCFLVALAVHPLLKPRGMPSDMTEQKRI